MRRGEGIDNSASYHKCECYPQLFSEFGREWEKRRANASLPHDVFHNISSVRKISSSTCFMCHNQSQQNITVMFPVSISLVKMSFLACLSIVMWHILLSVTFQIGLLGAVCQCERCTLLFSRQASSDNLFHVDDFCLSIQVPCKQYFCRMDIISVCLRCR